MSWISQEKVGFIIGPIIVVWNTANITWEFLNSRTGRCYAALMAIIVTTAIIGHLLIN